MQAMYTPGAWVVIRDCKWIFRRADPSDDGGFVLTVDGLSELVSGKSARFLTRPEEEAFGKPETPLRVLLCSGVASEGINLQYLSHRLVHFDLPWLLMVFQLRYGWVGRYGQSEKPIITYRINRSDNLKVSGDRRILEILKEKDEQAYKKIGDPATFKKVHDPEAEEALTMEAMAEGTDAAAFDSRYQPDNSNEGDVLLVAVIVLAIFHVDATFSVLATLVSLGIYVAYGINGNRWREMHLSSRSYDRVNTVAFRLEPREGRGALFGGTTCR